MGGSTGRRKACRQLHRAKPSKKGVPGVSELHLLPYHRLGEPKYERLGRRYPLQGARPLSPEAVSRLAALVTSAGLRVVIGG